MKRIVAIILAALLLVANCAFADSMADNAKKYMDEVHARELLVYGREKYIHMYNKTRQEVTIIYYSENRSGLKSASICTIVPVEIDGEEWTYVDVRGNPVRCSWGVHKYDGKYDLPEVVLNGQSAIIFDPDMYKNIAGKAGYYRLSNEEREEYYNRVIPEPTTPPAFTWWW